MQMDSTDWASGSKDKVIIHPCLPAALREQ